MDWRSYRKEQTQHPCPVSGALWAGVEPPAQNPYMSANCTDPSHGHRCPWGLGRAELIPTQQSGTEQINQALKDLCIFIRSSDSAEVNSSGTDIQPQQTLQSCRSSHWLCMWAGEPLRKNLNGNMKVKEQSVPKS